MMNDQLNTFVEFIYKISNDSLLNSKAMARNNQLESIKEYNVLLKNEINDFKSKVDNFKIQVKSKNVQSIILEKIINLINKYQYEYKSLSSDLIKLASIYIYIIDTYKNK